jgi:hypothetical protein
LIFFTNRKIAKRPPDARMFIKLNPRIKFCNILLCHATEQKVFMCVRITSDVNTCRSRRAKYATFSDWAEFLVFIHRFCAVHPAYLATLSSQLRNLSNNCFAGEILASRKNNANISDRN